MNRRQFLAAGGFAGTVAVAGCLDMIMGSGPTVPDGMSVVTRHTTGKVLQEPVLRPSYDADINSYHLLITDLSAAEDWLAPEEPDEGPSPDPRDISFIEDTAFDQSYIVIVQYGMQSLRSLELRKIERIDGGIRLTVETVDPDDGYNDDWTAHSKVIRITDDDEGVPDEVVAEVDGNPTELGEVAD